MRGGLGGLRIRGSVPGASAPRLRPAPELGLRTGPTGNASSPASGVQPVLGRGGPSAARLSPGPEDLLPPLVELPGPRRGPPSLGRVPPPAPGAQSAPRDGASPVLLLLMWFEGGKAENSRAGGGRARKPHVGEAAAPPKGNETPQPCPPPSSRKERRGHRAAHSEQAVGEPWRAPPRPLPRGTPSSRPSSALNPLSGTPTGTQASPRVLLGTPSASGHEAEGHTGAQGRFGVP